MVRIAIFHVYQEDMVLNAEINVTVQETRLVMQLRDVCRPLVS